MSTTPTPDPTGLPPFGIYHDAHGHPHLSNAAVADESSRLTPEELRTLDGDS